MTNFPNRGYYRGNLAAFVQDFLLVPKVYPLQKEVLDVIESSRADSGEVQQQELPPTAPSTGQTLTQEERLGTPGPGIKGIARELGYTGDQCSTCFSMRVKIAGHCTVCEDCGSTSGCS